MSRAQEVIDAYEAWDPDAESSEDLATRLGISKARLYQILDKEGITPKARRPRSTSLSERIMAARGGWDNPKTADEITRRGVQSLLDELEGLRREVAEYRERYGPLSTE